MMMFIWLQVHDDMKLLEVSLLGLSSQEYAKYDLKVKYMYHIISCHIISFHIISYHIISYHIISYHIISYHIISYHIISYHIIHML